MSYRELLTPDNCVVTFIDHQPQMAFGVGSIDSQLLKNNVVALAKSTEVFDVPTILTAVETESFSGYIWPELLDALPDNEPIERSSMNAWDENQFVEAVGSTGRSKLLLAGLWTEVCVNLPALEALDDGYEVYAVTDASGGTTVEAHDMAIERMTQAGVTPVTWQQVLLEWQRDWSREETYDPTLQIVKEHSGAYGMGVDYAFTHVHGAEQRADHPHDVPSNTETA